MKGGVLASTMAAIASLFLHLSGVHLLWAEEDVEIAGGTEIRPARMGNSFQDIAQGMKEPLPPETLFEEDTAETLIEPTEPEDLPEEEIAETPKAQTSDNVQKPTPPAQEVAADKPQHSATARADQTPAVPIEDIAAQAIATPSPANSPAMQIQPDTGIPISPSETVTDLQVVPEPALDLAAQTVPPEATSVPIVEPDHAAQRQPQTPLSTTPAETMPVLKALPAVDEDTPAVQVSARPASRPKSIEDEAKRIAEAKRAEDKAKQEAAKARNEPENLEKTQPTQQAQGAAEPDQRRGTTTGQLEAKNAEESTKRANRSTQSGNAAASNYRGLVQRRIARQRQPNIRGKGRVVVSFVISNSGALSSVGISQSSGRPDLDRAALQMVRRAAPFPEPPPGARRNWVQPMTVGR
ncbi:MAG: TonB family protein [Pseudomonadota bacterium]